MTQSDIEGRVARLERIATSAIGVDLAEFDDADQAAARAKDAEAAAKDADKQAAAAAKADEKAAAAQEGV